MTDVTAGLESLVSELDLTGRSFLAIHDFAPAEVVALLDLAAELKDVQRRRVRMPSSPAAPSPWSS